MNFEDLRKIEIDLCIKLPKEYIKRVLKHPFKNKNKFNFVFNSFYDDPNKIISINKSMRDQGISKSKKWPNNFFIIGCIKDLLDIYFIKLDDANVLVYFLEIGKDRFSDKTLWKLKIADSLDEFINDRKALQEIYDNP